MQAIRSLLVVLDPGHAHGLALARAKTIAVVTQAHLHLVMCDHHQDHSALLSLLKSQLHDEGFSASAEQAWEGNLEKTVITVQQAEGCGLVIKQHLHDTALKRFLLTPADWKLLRYCPCAVLMVKSERPWAGGVVLAAVDVGNTDDEHRSLHSSIIEFGVDIAQVATGQLHVIAAHPAPMLLATDPTFQRTHTLQAHYRAQCRAFQVQFGIDDTQLHIAEGPADVLIPYTAQMLDAVVTVMGTVARTGVAGALIGNTAEVVLDTLESDVLVLKTDEIIAHLEDLARA